MFSLSPFIRVFVYSRPTDMRRSFRGLTALVRNQLAKDPLSGHLFLFRSRRGDYLKILWWDNDGFAIFAKRLEKGIFRFPVIQFVDGACVPIELERSELLLLLEGIDIKNIQRQKRYRRIEKAA
jgi:transposase